MHFLKRITLLSFIVLGLGACAGGQWATGTGGSAATGASGGVTAPSTTQAGASDSAQMEPNFGAGSP